MRLVILLFLSLVADALASSRKLPQADDAYSVAERPYIQTKSRDEVAYSITFTTDKPTSTSFRKTETIYFKPNSRIEPVSGQLPFRSSNWVSHDGSRTMVYEFEFAFRPVGNVVRVIGFDGTASMADKVLPFEQPIVIPWNKLTHTETIDGIRYDAEVKWKKP